jgi:hypothetical protein
MRLSKKLREHLYYSVTFAGSQVGYSRPAAYRSADRGDIPTVQNGRYRLVPKAKWDRIVKRLLTPDQDPDSTENFHPGGQADNINART